jgi:type IV pilus assembly protein PilN
MIALVAVWALLAVAGLFTIGTLRYLDSSKIQLLTAELSSMQSELVALKEKTKSVSQLETKQQELRDKLGVIASLKRSKIGPVRMIDDLNLALPERSWLVGVSETNGVLRISGIALDNQTIALFMENLAKSNYFEKIDLIESKVADSGAVKLRQFIVDAKVNYSGRPEPQTSVPPNGGRSI